MSVLKQNPNLTFIFEHTESIREDFVHLTENVLKKDMKSANKQLQDTLMNYFLENQVGSLLKQPMNQTSKRAIRLHIEKELPETGTKYINLLNAFERNLKQYEVSNEYIELLRDIIVKPNSFERDQDQWKALVRKRILAILLYVHWFAGETKQYADFFQIWDEVFPENPLPKRKPKQKRKKKDLSSATNIGEKKIRKNKKDIKLKMENNDDEMQQSRNGDDFDDDDEEDDEYDQTQKSSTAIGSKINIKQESMNSFPIEQMNQIQLNSQQNFPRYSQTSQNNNQQQNQNQQNQQPFINLNFTQNLNCFGQNLQQPSASQTPQNDFPTGIDPNTLFNLQNFSGNSPIMAHHQAQLQQGGMSPQQSQGSPNNGYGSPMMINTPAGNQYANFSQMSMNMDYTPKIENGQAISQQYQQMINQQIQMQLKRDSNSNNQININNNSTNNTINNNNNNNNNNGDSGDKQKNDGTQLISDILIENMNMDQFQQLQQQQNQYLFQMGSLNSNNSPQNLQSPNQNLNKKFSLNMQSSFDNLDNNQQQNQQNGNQQQNPQNNAGGANKRRVVLLQQNSNGNMDGSPSNNSPFGFNNSPQQFLNFKQHMQQLNQSQFKFLNKQSGSRQGSNENNIVQENNNNNDNQNNNNNDQNLLQKQRINLLKQGSISQSNTPQNFLNPTLNGQTFDMENIMNSPNGNLFFNQTWQQVAANELVNQNQMGQFNGSPEMEINKQLANQININSPQNGITNNTFTPNQNLFQQYIFQPNLQINYNNNNGNNGNNGNGNNNNINNNGNSNGNMNSNNNINNNISNNNNNNSEMEQESPINANQNQQQQNVGQSLFSQQFNQQQQQQQFLQQQQNDFIQQSQQQQQNQQQQQFIQNN